MKSNQIRLLVGALAMLGFVAANNAARADEVNAASADQSAPQEQMPVMFINVDTKQVVQVDENGAATPVDQQTVQALSEKWHAPDTEANDGSTKADNFFAQTVAFRGIGGGINLGPIGGGFHLGRGGIGGGAHIGPIGGGAGIGRGGVGGGAHLGPIGGGAHLGRGGFYGGGRWHRHHWTRHGRYYAGEWAPYTACNSTVNSEFCF